MYILGINSVYHESSVALIKDGKLVYAIEEERFNRIKHAKKASINNSNELPLKSLQYCLEQENIKLSDIEYIGFSFLPDVRLATKTPLDYVENDNWGSVSGELIFFRNTQDVAAQLKQMGFKGAFIWLNHHDCHAASSFFVSSFSDATIISIDGIGESESTVISRGSGNNISRIKTINYPNSLGFLWEKITKFLGFSEYDAWKVMGLSAYGDSKIFDEHFRKLYQIFDNGEFSINNDILQFRLDNFTKLEKLFQIKKREKDANLLLEHKNIAATLQAATNEIILNLSNGAYRATKCDRLCLAGGLALNCISNSLVLEKGPFKELFIQPAANDAGTAIGAALIIWNSILGNSRIAPLTNHYLGPKYSQSVVEKVLKDNKLEYYKSKDICHDVAMLISQNNIIGWFQGALEFGPRALGNRSLLADPRNISVRELLNEKVKHRELFRPFAPSLLEEYFTTYYDVQKKTEASNYMLINYRIKPEYSKKIPAVVHVDGTSRVQTVSKNVNPKYHSLISAFNKITGVPVLLNTSFNDNEPIVCTPQDAINTFKKTRIDYLAIDDFLVKIDRKNPSQN